MINTYINRKLKEFGDEYFLTEFDIVNPTSAPVTYDLFNSNTLTLTPTAPNILPPSVSTNIYNFPATSWSLNAVNPSTNTGYVAAANDLYVFDLNTNTLSTTIPLDSINSVCYNSIDNTMFTIYQDTLLGNDYYVAIIDCVTNTIINTLFICTNVGSSGQQPLVFNSTNNTVYFSKTVGANDYVSVYDCATNTIVTDILVTGFPQGMAFCPTNNYIYITNGGGQVYFIDCNTNTVVSNVATTYNNCFPIAFNSQSNQMYVGSNDGVFGIIDVIDCTTNTISLSINTPFYCPTISYNPLFNYMYVGDFFGQTIFSIDCNSNTIISTYSISPYSTYQIVYNPANNTNFYQGVLNFSVSDSIFVQAPSSASNSYITGSYNYNQFLQDIKNNPCLVRIAMLYSQNANNLNQVFFDTVKDANGEITYRPQTPSLEISTNQYQASVAKVEYGKKGFVLNQESSWSNFVVQPYSSVRIILLQKQFPLISLLTNKESNCIKLENNLLFREATTVSQKIKIVRDDLRALPLEANQKKSKPKPSKNKEANRCAEVWEEHYGASGESEIKETKNEFLGMPTNVAVGLGAVALAIGSIAILSKK